MAHRKIEPSRTGNLYLLFICAIAPLVAFFDRVRGRR